MNECITYYISKFKRTKAFKTLKRSFRLTTVSEGSAGSLVCNECNESGMLIACDTCEAHYHLDCAKPPLASIPEGLWSCHNCRRPTRRRRDADSTQSTVDGLLTQDELSVSTAGGQSGNTCVIVPKNITKKKRRSQACTNGIRHDCPKCDKQGLKRKGLEAHYGMKHGGKIDWSAVITYDVGDKSGILPKPLSITPPSIAEGVETELLDANVPGKGSVSAQGIEDEAEKCERALQVMSQSSIRYDCPKCDRQGLKRKGLEAHYGMKHGGKVDWPTVTSYEVDENTSVAVRPITHVASSRDEAIPISELSGEILAKPRSTSAHVEQRGSRADEEVNPSTAVRPTTRHNSLPKDAALNIAELTGKPTEGWSQDGLPGIVCALGQETKSVGKLSSSFRYDCPKCDITGLKRKGLESHYGLMHGGKVDWSKVTPCGVYEPVQLTTQHAKRLKVADSDECTIATVGMSADPSNKIDEHQLEEDFKQPKAIANEFVKGNRRTRSSTGRSPYSRSGFD